MATASPAPNNNNSSAISSASTTPSKPTTLAAAASSGHRMDIAPKSQRGQNKPKCRQCGNVARSRCPYEQCKSCCSRNQNPCHIHVLKANSSHSEKTPASAAAPLDLPSSEPSQSGNVSRAASLRQLSNSFAQFNNLHVSLRSRKPLTRKDAAAINEWRLSRLREYKERNIEVENEAFDRYMQSVDLLKEVLSVESMEDNTPSVADSNQISVENNNETMIQNLKLQLRSSSIRSDRMRMQIQQIVDEGLKKAKKWALDGHNNESIDEEESNQASKRVRTERLSVISDLIEKINRARNEEDLKSCLEVKLQLFNSDKGSCTMELEDNETPKNKTDDSNTAPAKEIDYSLPKLVGTAEIDQETLNIIDKQFSSFEHVEEL
ncbi:uncharacterized protein LOC129310461 [Prosopis cineraria]|uniref:uncharacterized protein LOC129310461 n=1 Tax=Prosopis cineraria TaxID=364024 RepID=UPI00240F1822|nr:uncharacterized protein LOC129310461 [Prosopis cineraria]